jgi:hypothetical protein
MYIDKKQKCIYRTDEQRVMQDMERGLPSGEIVATTACSSAQPGTQRAIYVY